MKTFIKWLIWSTLLLIALIGYLAISGQYNPNSTLEALLISVGSILSIAFFMYVLEDKYAPYRTKKLVRKMERIFEGKQITESTVEFDTGRFKVWAEVRFKFSLLMYGTGEFIHFHITYEQIANSPVKPSFKTVDETCNNYATKQIYLTNGWGLKLAKKRIEQLVRM